MSESHENDPPRGIGVAAWMLAAIVVFICLYVLSVGPASALYESGNLPFRDSEF